MITMQIFRNKKTTRTGGIVVWSPVHHLLPTVTHMSSLRLQAQSAPTAGTASGYWDDLSLSELLAWARVPSSTC